MEEILQQILVKLENLENGQVELQKGQEKLQKDVIEIKEIISNNKLEHDSYFKQIDKQLNTFNSIIPLITREQNKMKEDINYLDFLTLKLDKAVNIIHDKIQS